METIITSADLKTAISELEKKQSMEEVNLREQFHMAYESMKPINLIKNSLKEATSDIDFKQTVINSSVGIGSGVLSSILLKGIVGHPVKKFIGSAIIYGITSYASKHPETFNAIGTKVINLFKKRSSDPTIAK